NSSSIRKVVILRSLTHVHRITEYTSSQTGTNRLWDSRVGSATHADCEVLKHYGQKKGPRRGHVRRRQGKEITDETTARASRVRDDDITAMITSRDRLQV